MKICPICQKEDFVIIKKTEVGKRTYYCLRCNWEWEDRPSSEEETNFNS